MQTAFALYPGFTMLDFVGPYQVLSNVPGIEVVLCAAEPGTVSWNIPKSVCELVM